MSNMIYYVGMDVHLATIVIAVLDGRGKLVMESVIETNAVTILNFIQGLRGTVVVTFEEGTQATWLYELLRRHVADVVVCDPRRNKLLQVGEKADRVDAKKLAHLLRAGLLQPVYHGSHGTRGLKELARAYDTLARDSTRVMNRIKAIFRGRGIGCAGQGVYRVQKRQPWLEQLTEPGVRRRAELLYAQLDHLIGLRDQARDELVAESQKHPASRLLRRIPQLGKVRVAQMIAIVDTPHRFRTKRQFWAYCGLAVVTAASAQYQVVNGEIRKSDKGVLTRGLNRNHNRTLKSIFKSAAVRAAVTGPFKPYHDQLIARGMRPPMARLTLARKLATITLKIWKTGEVFDAKKLMEPTT